MAIRSAAFESNPLRPEIPFFEDMHGDPAAVGEIYGNAMVWPAIAEEHDIGHAALTHERTDESSPARESPAIVYGSKPRPEDTVAAGEIDTLNPVAPRGDRVRQAHKKRRRQALQKQEGSWRSPAACHRHPHPTPGPACPARDAPSISSNSRIFATPPRREFDLV